MSQLVQNDPSTESSHAEHVDQVFQCPCCGASIIYIPSIACSHCGKDLDIACYVYRRDGAFYGECLTLNLVSRGTTEREAILRLQGAMFSYVEAVLAGGKGTKGLIPRPAPLASWLRYYSYVARRRLARMLGRRTSLETTSVPAPNSAHYTVAEC